MRCDGVTPDLLAVAKSMAGGIPMGACLIGRRAGWPRSATAARSAATRSRAQPSPRIDVLARPDHAQRRDAASRAARLGAWLVDAIRSPGRPVRARGRGRGLLVGVELRSKVTPVLQQLQGAASSLPAGMTVLRLLPPLVITEDELARVVDALREVL